MEARESRGGGGRHDHGADVQPVTSPTPLKPRPKPRPKPKPSPILSPAQALTLTRLLSSHLVEGRADEAEALQRLMADRGVEPDSVVKVPPLAVPQLGSCASSERTWRLWAARHSQEVSGPLGAQPRPRVLELAASKAAEVTAFDHPAPTITPRRCWAARRSASPRSGCGCSSGC